LACPASKVPGRLRIAIKGNLLQIACSEIDDLQPPSIRGYRPVAWALHIEVGEIRDR
jgi:hypothetical protein